MHFTDGFYCLCFNSVIVLFFKYIDPDRIYIDPYRMMSTWEL